MDQPLTVHATCRNGLCVFDGNDLFIDIAITNPGTSPVGFPLALRQKTGPSIRLVDNRTKAESNLRTNLANLDLANEFTEIGPGQSVKIEWVIKPSEIQRMAKPEIDISAEIIVACKIRAEGRLVEFRGLTTLHIVGK